MKKINTEKRSREDTHAKSNEDKNKPGWFLLQAEVIIGVCCYYWSFRISLTGEWENKSK